MNTNKKYLSVADIKEYLNISQTAAYGLVHRKDFPVCHFGGTIRIPKDAFLEWIEIHSFIPNELRASFCA